MPLSAYAPLIPKGEIDFSGSVSSFDTKYFYNKEGKQVDSYNTFHRIQTEVLLEFGATDKDNLTLYAVYDFIKDRLNGDSNELGDPEIRWKRSLVEWDCAIVSAEIIAIVPFINKYEPEVRYGRYGGEAALLGAQTFFPFGYKTTLDGRIAYRFYSGFPSDQIRSDLSVWIDITRQWQFFAQSSVEFGLFNGKEPPNHSFFFYNAKYRVWKGIFGVSYSVTDRIAFNASYMRHFIGQNIAVGGEWIAGITYCY